MGWNKIKEWLCYNFSSVATKQHVASVLTDQQQKPTETARICTKSFGPTQIQQSLPHQAKDLAHITHFICNLLNQKLQHYMFGKNPTSVQNAIMLEQKRMWNYSLFKAYIIMIQDTKLTTFIINKNDNQNNMGPCHVCNCPHLVKDCEESICKRCKPNLDSHTPARCPRKSTSNRQQKLTLIILKTVLEISLMVTMTQIYNCVFPPVNQIILLNY